ncbi:hypothetical protein [Actinokineospora sp. NBRC 105648]|uniref:hypothetical protein n=1 Tax=Actinokineospora sp. NBRC 105648 TaxID=3032206 RepID=UPI0024A477DC|nr:hypothetical protein [Actinokineospora sp. NBRC 105648]GLZ43527.1 hypothetical protein Acsp05_71510 [Actinokineospora sp. NBRC 105648]
MAQEIRDVSPPSARHIQTPNTTFDVIERANALGVYVLAAFLRHSDSYGMTLTKVIDHAGGVGEAQLSRAYNAVIRCGCLVRVEWSHTAPAGTRSKENARSSTTLISKVPLTDGQVREQVAAFAPGKYQLVPWGTGVLGDDGKEIYERRRVKVMAAEAYTSSGVYRIRAGGEWELHPKPRGAEWKQLNAATAKAKAAAAKAAAATLTEDDTQDDDLRTRVVAAAQRAAALASAAQEAADDDARRIAKKAKIRADRARARALGEPDPHKPQEPLSLFAPEPGNPGSGLTSANTTNPQVAPEPGNPGSGLTSANTTNPQVAPEPGIPGSTKNYEEKTNENTKSPRKREAGPADAGTATRTARPGPMDDAQLDQGITTGAALSGDHQTARAKISVPEVDHDAANDDAPDEGVQHPAADGPLTAEQARAAIARTIRTKSARKPRSGPAGTRTRPVPVEVDLHADWQAIAQALAHVVTIARGLSPMDAYDLAAKATATNLIGADFNDAVTALRTQCPDLDHRQAVWQVRRDRFADVAARMSTRGRGTRPGTPLADVEHLIRYTTPASAEAALA